MKEIVLEFLIFKGRFFKDLTYFIIRYRKSKERRRKKREAAWKLVIDVSGKF